MQIVLTLGLKKMLPLHPPPTTPKIVGRFRPWGMVGEESGDWKGRWKGTLLARVTFSEAAPPAPRIVSFKFSPCARTNNDRI